jgi:squalene-hopene/tetraprenyl-beta-curcumene cyclase
MMQKKELEQRICELGKNLVLELKPEGYWEGRLSSSALGVAVAVAALYFDNSLKHSVEIEKGLNWLKNNINFDGSFGDTPESPGNVSTSLLVYAAANLFREEKNWIISFQKQIAGYLQKQNIDIHSAQVSKVILDHYQKDYTFSVPILAMSGLCGIPGKDAFSHIPQLPFELSLLPRKFYRLLNLSVVSYAIPALVAVGIVIYKKKNSGLFWRMVRKFSVPHALKILHRMLPESGGYLEAIPLTAFVALSLINAGYGETEVVKKGIDFLKNTQREDGGWPIDVDLSTWVTSLSVKAFRSNLNGFINTDLQDKITDHFKLIQTKSVHPFNGSGPGGWGWTNFPGSVPDGDDTPGTILAMLKMEPAKCVKTEIYDGCRWLFRLQNSDGGFPTFSKGWGKLPFDQSCSDLTGHSLLAFSSVMETYGDALSGRQKKRLVKAFEKALHYLKKHQRRDGSWLPLWFGNQLTEDHTNPVYGTARVVTYLKDSLEQGWLPEDFRQRLAKLVSNGKQYLISVQNKDGSWGGAKNIPGTMEETALAVSALASVENREVCDAGLTWLDNFYRQNGLKPAPIGLYFASLWYDEKLYPATAYLEAVSRMLELPEA